MKIGLIAPPWVPVPPVAYGGTEAVIADLAVCLRSAGHEVVLFTVGESTCPVRRRHLYPAAVPTMNDALHEAAHARAAYQAMADEAVDVVHDHTLLGPLLARATGFDSAPVIVTNHSPFGAETNALFAASGEVAVVAISHAQARGATGPVSAVIHHGIDLASYRAGPGGGDYLLFVGRMSADKGVHRAVRVAHATGRRLVMAAKMRQPEELEYFERQVRPLLRPGDEPPRERPLHERIELLRHADALLLPIRWPEPFGLVMVEALASGTPVLAFPLGAAPEIVQDGRTGFLCADEAAMVAAAKRIPELDRRACRTDAERRFGRDRMTDDYLRLYRRVRTRWECRQVDGAA